MTFITVPVPTHGFLAPMLHSPSPVRIRIRILLALVIILVHSGYGIWVQGPSAPDQAQRRVFLDGIDMGAYNAKADDRSPSRPFWGKDDLEYTTHTVVIVHNDTRAMILALDAWM